MSGQRSKKATEERAVAAIEHYQKRYAEFHDNDAPFMRYEANGWIAVSCRADRMMFPQNKRIKDLEADTRMLELKLQHRGRKMARTKKTIE